MVVGQAACFYGSFIKSKTHARSAWTGYKTRDRGAPYLSLNGINWIYDRTPLLKRDFL